eukprot:jgi/Chlat1/3262/Chrsp22S03523
MALSSCCLLLLLVLAPAAADFTFTIVHINDVHARIEQADSAANACPAASADAGLCYGGYARLVQQAKDITAAATEPVLVLDAGDQFTGTLWSIAYNGYEAASFQPLLGVQAMTLGNHEFDKGPEVLAQYIRNVTTGAKAFPVISANIDVTPGSPLSGLIRPSTTFEVGPTRVKVGVCGLTTTETAYSSSGGPTVQFNDYVPALTKCAADLKSNGVNIVIALTHIGYAEDQALAPQVPGIDLVIGGHSHTFLDSGSPPVLNTATGAVDTSSGGYPTVVASNVEAGKQIPIYQITLTFDDSGDLLTYTDAPILMGGSGSSNNVAMDAETNALIETLAGPVRATSGEVLGSTEVLLDAERPQVRQRETNFGDLSAEALLQPFKSSTDRFEVAVTNGGGIRASILPGTIRREQVLTAFPFGNYVVAKRMTGKQIRNALENAYSRVISVQIRVDGVFVPLDDNELYNVATNDFVGSGGDNHTDVAAAPYVFNNGAILADVLAEYIRQNSPIRITNDGRITVLNNSVVISPTPTPTPAPAPAPTSCTLSVSCPSSIIFSCPDATPTPAGGAGFPTVVCNTSAVRVAYVDTVTPGCGVSQTVSRAWSAFELSTGASATCFQLISTTNFQLPSFITVPRNISLSCSEANGTPASRIRNWLANVKASGACGEEVTVSNNAPDVFPTGTTIVTFTASSACGGLKTVTAKVVVGKCQCKNNPQPASAFVNRCLDSPITRCVDGYLARYGISGVSTTCQGIASGTTACAQARRELTAALINKCTGAFGSYRTCTVKPAAACPSHADNLLSLLADTAKLLKNGRCNDARTCAAAINAGSVITE